MREDNIEKYRYFLKDDIRKEVDFYNTDQNIGVNPPPIEKEVDERSTKIDLPDFDDIGSVKKTSVYDAIKNRKSIRKYSEKAFSLDELSFLLWATQGVRKRLGDVVFRNVPSAGNRHAFETYLGILNVKKTEPGIYRYMPLKHGLVLVNDYKKEILSKKIVNATLGQSFTGLSAVVFFWSVIPYRGEWRYGKAAHKVIAIDAGHVCQNLYLACHSISSGTCAIAAYDQSLSDELLGIDGKEEFVIYVSSVGKLIGS